MVFAERRRLAQPGFSFIELVVAIMILGVIIGVGVPAYMAWVERAKVRATKTSLMTIKGQVDLYQMEFNKYPTKLIDLVEKPKGEAAKGWKPFLPKLPKDGWNRDFYYRVTSGKKHPYDLYSYGADGPEGGAMEDRISVWE